MKLIFIIWFVCLVIFGFLYFESEFRRDRNN